MRDRTLLLEANPETSPEGTGALFQPYFLPLCKTDEVFRSHLFIFSLVVMAIIRLWVLNVTISATRPLHCTPYGHVVKIVLL